MPLVASGQLLIPVVTGQLHPSARIPLTALVPLVLLSSQAFLAVSRLLPALDLSAPSPPTIRMIGGVPSAPAQPRLPT